MKFDALGNNSTVIIKLTVLEHIQSQLLIFILTKMTHMLYHHILFISYHYFKSCLITYYVHCLINQVLLIFIVIEIIDIGESKYDMNVTRITFVYLCH